LDKDFDADLDKVLAEGLRKTLADFFAARGGPDLAAE
jgi:hypothetical protein